MLMRAALCFLICWLENMQHRDAFPENPLGLNSRSLQSLLARLSSPTSLLFPLQIDSPLHRLRRFLQNCTPVIMAEVSKPNATRSPPEPSPSAISVRTPPPLTSNSLFYGILHLIY